MLTLALRPSSGVSNIAGFALVQSEWKTSVWTEVEPGSLCYRETLTHAYWRCFWGLRSGLADGEPQPWVGAVLAPQPGLRPQAPSSGPGLPGCKMGQ